MRRNQFGRFIGRNVQNNGPALNLIQNLWDIVNLIFVIIGYSPILFVLYIIFQYLDIPSISNIIFEKYICKCNCKENIITNGSKGI